MKSAKHEQKYGEPVLVISSEEEAVVDIAVGGFGIELDQHQSLRNATGGQNCDEDNNEGDVSSLNLNSGILATPPQNNQNMSSPQKQNNLLDDHFDHEMSGIASQGGFQLQVEQVRTG